MGHFLLKALKYNFTVYHLDKGITIGKITFSTEMISLNNNGWRVVKYLLNASTSGESSSFY